MKNYFLSLTALILLCICSKTDANVWDEYNENATSCYIGVSGGLNFLSTCSDWDAGIINPRAGFIISGSLGCRLFYGFRLEGEYAYRRNAIHDRVYTWEGDVYKFPGHFHSSSYMANLIWDIPLKTWNPCLKVQPYIGAGMGYDCQHVHGHRSKIRYQIRNNDHFAWQVIAGMSYPIICDADLTLDYKFHRGNFCHGYRINSHSIAVGLVYNFRNPLSFL